MMITGGTGQGAQGAQGQAQPGRGVGTANKKKVISNPE